MFSTTERTIIDDVEVGAGGHVISMRYMTDTMKDVIRGQITPAHASYVVG